MIRLTRIRNADPLYLNPDHIERLEQHAETTVRLANGNEYVVVEKAEDIVEMIRHQRALLLATAFGMAPQVLIADPADDERGAH